MGKHDVMSPKAVANRIKAKGLQRLRWYCQMCEKQCRDQNGFKCHCASESHQRQMAIFAENPERYLEQFSQEFEDVFLSILSRRYGTKRVHANQVYQEIVADRQHLHMNATKWDTLSDFVMYLGREGKCKVEESERGWFIEWVDTSPEALARKEAILKKERQEMDDEQREQRLLREQIDKAQKSQMAMAERDAAGVERPEATALKREGSGQPIKLSLKPIARSTAKLVKANPLKKPAAAKPSPFASLQKKVQAGTAGTSRSSSSHAEPKKPLSAVEEIMKHDQLRKEAAAASRRAHAEQSLPRSRSPELSRYSDRRRGRSRSPQRK
ncbi:hypothetical protein GQ54DRAFT_295577 [Martensiomyces pterosporus]|nr:hypothetical protein GQ54DRAFT_295577 [Martensiomyces pterosporus]